MANLSTNSQVDENCLIQRGLIESIIRLIGDDPTREGLIDTPKRVLKSYKDLFKGYKQNPLDVLKTTFDGGAYSSMVICKDIEFYSTCEHHMIPFYGLAHVGYIPRERVVGLSKLARLVDIFARRLQIQEQMTDQIADSLQTALDPSGVMVVVKAKHMCMCARGVQKQSSWMVTSSIRGVFDEPKVRAEFMELIK